MAEDIADVLAGRPPRHRAEPLPAPSPGEETMVSRPEASLPVLALEPPAPRPRRHLPLRALSLTLLLGGLALYYLSVSGPEHLAEVVAFLLTPPVTVRPAVSRRMEESPSDPTATASPSPSPEPTEAAAASAEPVATATADLGASSSAAPAPSPSPSMVPSGSLEAHASGPAPDDTANDEAASPDTAPPPGAAESAAGEIAPIVLPDTDEVGSEDSSPAPPSPKATPSEAPSARPSPPTPPAASPSPRASAELAIHLEHPLEKGTVRAWLDGKLVFRGALSTVVTKKILFFTFKGGHVRETLRVNAGEHLLRVEVRGEGRADAGQATVEFKPAAKRLLFVRPASTRGRLTFQWR